MSVSEPVPATSPPYVDAHAAVRAWVLLLVTAIGLYLCYRMAVPFLPALAWASTLAVLFVPLQRWLESRLARPGLAAAVALVLIALIVVVPLAIVGQQIVLQVAAGADLIQAKIAAGEWRHALQTQPWLAGLADRVEQQLDLPGTAKEVATAISGITGKLVKGSIYQVVGVVLTFYLLFFFLRDRDIVLRSLHALSPLDEAQTRQLFDRVDDTIHATVYGALAVSSVQGLLGGLMFWWLGLSAPLLWGVVMALLAMVPVIGAFVVWLPACLWLLLQGSWIKALILALWGMFVVGTIDNLLRPVLVGNRLRQHTVLAFLSVVGGLIVFGASGLVLGPVTLTVTTALLRIWSGRPLAAAPVEAIEART